MATQPPFPLKFTPIFQHVPVIVSTNYKGGVGKTLSSRVLAQGISDPFSAWFSQGKPVLVLDFDPQGNTSRRWGLLHGVPGDETGAMMPNPHPELLGSEPNYSSVCDPWDAIIEAHATGQPIASEWLEPVPYQTSNPLIHVLPADELRMRAVAQLPDAYTSHLGSRLSQWLRSPAVAEKYCAVIIDTAPAKSHLIDAALMAATHVYIPFVPEPQSAEGVLSIITYVGRFAAMRTSNDPLHLIGLLPNMVRRTQLHTMYLKQLTDQVVGEFMMPVRLNDRITYAETDSSGTTPDTVTAVTDSNIAVEARKFIKCVLERVCITSATNFPRAA